MVREGDSAPEFRLMGSDGREHTLSEFRGSRLVLYFYPRDDTPGCTTEAKEFNGTLAELEGKGAKVVGVSKDSLESHEKFRKKYGLNFLLLSDPESRTIKEYGSYGDRGIFGMGTLRKTFIIGKTGKIEKVFDKVSPKGHGAEVASCVA